MEGSACVFVFLRAAPIRALTDEQMDEMVHLSPLAELRRESRRTNDSQYVDWLVTRTLSVEESLRGTYAANHLAVSHRWQVRTRPALSHLALHTPRDRLSQVAGPPCTPFRFLRSSFHLSTILPCSPSPYRAVSRAIRPLTTLHLPTHGRQQ